jgi:hypothetical protein
VLVLGDFNADCSYLGKTAWVRPSPSAPPPRSDLATSACLVEGDAWLYFNKIICACATLLLTTTELYSRCEGGGGQVMCKCGTPLGCLPFTCCCRLSELLTTFIFFHVSVKECMRLINVSLDACDAISVSEQLKRQTKLRWIATTVS